MCEDSKNNYLKAEQEVWCLMDIFGQCMSLSSHTVTGSYHPTEVHDNIRTSIHWTDTVLTILNGAKEMRTGNWYVLL